VLNAYLTQTKRLLQNPSAPTTLYSPADLTDYINVARGQLAGEARCVRLLSTISTVVGQRNYNFSDLATATGIAGILHVRSIRYAVGQGYKWMSPRSWPWFEYYYLNNPVPPSGAPQQWSQFGQGASGVNLPMAGATGSGTFFVNPLPDLVYVLTCDCACYPTPLASDSDPEVIPYEWTDAVPFYAAYYALLSSQTSARMADGERYYQYYQQFVQRARDAATPDILQYQYEQQPDPTALNQMGLPGPKGGGAGAAQ
jgi:hypothetical protein